MSGVLENKIGELTPRWLEILDPPQAVAVTAMTTPGLLGLCLFDEQGIGKTLTTIAAFLLGAGLWCVIVLGLFLLGGISFALYARLSQYQPMSW